MRRRFGTTIFFLLLFCCTGSAWAAESCQRRPADAASLARLQQVMASGRFVAYEPTSLKVIDGRATEADPASIRRDLEVLRPKFDGLITYGALDGADRIPDIAAELGYRAVIVGVWDITNPREIDAALAAARRNPGTVVGISMGNEIVFGKRGTFPQIAAAIGSVRAKAPQLALTTTEPFHLFIPPDASDVLKQLDFMLVNVHPVFQPWFPTASAAQSAQFVVNVVDQLTSVYCGPVLVKETGVPTLPAASGYTPARQAGFYQALRDKFPSSEKRAFAYFSAFDAPWRVNDIDPVTNPVAGAHPEEGAWGLYEANRAPKPAALAIPNLPEGAASGPG